jgi:hypothetical protein
MKKAAILQSNYIPWKGYFDVIASVDEFILYDDMQYTRRDWRNRNKIKTSQGSLWLTIPVLSKGSYLEAMKNICISDSGWAERHWKTIRLNYIRAPFFAEFAPQIELLYEAAGKVKRLSEINHLFLRKVSDLLGINTPLTWSMDYDMKEGKNERLISICKQSGATHYLSGPAAKDYIDVSAFREAGIKVEWMDYSWYPEYEQRFGEFRHDVSILDVIFNCGEKAANFVWKHRA